MKTLTNHRKLFLVAAVMILTIVIGCPVCLVINYIRCSSPAAPSVNWTECIKYNEDLEGANLEGANLSGATYDDKTTWPAGFTPPPDAIKATE